MDKLNYEILEKTKTTVLVRVTGTVNNEPQDYELQFLSNEKQLEDINKYLDNQMEREIKRIIKSFKNEIDKKAIEDKKMIKEVYL